MVVNLGKAVKHNEHNGRRLRNAGLEMERDGKVSKRYKAMASRWFVRQSLEDMRIEDLATTIAV